jgi:hypothetical protein
VGSPSLSTAAYHIPTTRLGVGPSDGYVIKPSFSSSAERAYAGSGWSPVTRAETGRLEAASVRDSLHS